MDLEVKKGKYASKYYHRAEHIGCTEVKSMAIADMGFTKGRDYGSKEVNYITREYLVLYFAKNLDFEYLPLNDTDEILK